MTAPSVPAGDVAKLVEELRPFAKKALGSIRIDVVEVHKIVEALESLSRDLAEARAALERQSGNMAFVLNHASLPEQWAEKFDRELNEDRSVLPQKETASNE